MKYVQIEGLTDIGSAWIMETFVTRSDESAIQKWHSRKFFRFEVMSEEPVCVRLVAQGVSKYAPAQMWMREFAEETEREEGLRRNVDYSLTGS